MSTFPTATLTVTIDAPLGTVATDLADPATHPEWATEFFASPASPSPDGTGVSVVVPMMGGPVTFDVKGVPELGVLDLYLAPAGAPFGPPLPVRLIPNGDGVDVLWTLTRFPGMPDEVWAGGLASMERELDALRRRHEAGQPG
ncbi:MAG: hypothetical protein L0Z49_02625 [Actinobacteria bacterium]|nr:hypothetical protein [Actinomycetota bacterium]MCI0678176.1 hypothetical protein [Actinomycetota bacterium]